jgi:predicted enzyme related to lactoylglutathione lyase
MPLMDAYAPGTFCWADLGTSDAPDARRFYTALFGWAAEDRPAGPDTVYTILLRQGRSVAALYPHSAGVANDPPHWLSYVSVASADDAVKRVRALGGTAIDEPFDVLDVGRMAVVQDPGGAVLALWEPRRHVGAAVVGEPDTMCWNELVTPRPELARAFYSGLFGWTPAEGRTSAHTTFFGDGRPRAGMLAMEPSQGRGPSHWLVYFGVHDCEGQTALAQSLGGRVRARPAECPGADRYTVLDDPQGATFAVITLRGAATDGPG